MNKIEIIDDTVAFYGADPVNRRSVIEGHLNRFKCLYKGPEGKQCAFQRVVEDDLSEFDIKSPNCSFIMIDKPYLKFKPGYEGHDKDFWRDIQILHDSNENWDLVEGGLSVLGNQYVETLKKRYISEN